MENKIKFDFATLLTQGDFDIRSVAAENEELSALDYCDILSKLLDQAPDTIGFLSQMAELNGSSRAIDGLESMAAILVELGEGKLAPIFNVLTESGRKGSKEFAAGCAKRILPEYEELFKRVRAARKKRLGAKQPPSTRGLISESDISLSDALAEADYIEANRKMRVLAVDDTAFMLKTIEAALSEDYEVFSLTKSTMVESFLRNTTPELFLLDYNMPDISGFELVPIIRSFKEHKDTPIIFLTAMGTAEHVSTAMSLGASDYVVKPPDARVLRDKIAEHIIRKRSF